MSYAKQYEENENEETIMMICREKRRSLTLLKMTEEKKKNIWKKEARDGKLSS